MTPQAKTLIAPSILSADFSRLGEEVNAVAKAGADWIHVDVMDGHFVPNLTIGLPVVKSISKLKAPPLDVHLMIENPERYLEDFAKAGANLLSVHQEACAHLHRVVHQIRDLGVKAGVVLNPATPVSTIEHILSDIDFVLLMSVNPGFGGQKFIPAVLQKIKALAEVRQARGLSFLIEVDGGVNQKNAGELKRFGADVLVAGTAIFGAQDYAQAIRALRDAQ